MVGTFGDKADQEGEPIDWAKLATLLEVPVVPVVATRGQGIPALKRTILQMLEQRLIPVYPLPYPATMRSLVARMERLAKEANLPPRRGAFLFLLGEQQTGELLRTAGKLVEAEEWRTQFQRQQRIADLPLALFTFHQSLAKVIAFTVQKPHRHLPQRLERWITAPLSGTVTAIGLLLVIFFSLFALGNFLSEGITALWTASVSPLLRSLFVSWFGPGVVANVLLWGLDQGILAALTVGVPYILIFYLLLSFLEDTGYLSVLSFLGERLTRLFGLPGRSLVNMVASAGCNVPALSGLRLLPTMRERFIGSVLVLLVPCSARTAVILGAAGLYLGWWAALSVYGWVLLWIFLFGTLLHRFSPGLPSVVIAEIPPLRWPQARLVLRKTWFRFREFLFLATPILIVGSMILGTLYETGAIWSLIEPLKPLLEGWMGFGTTDNCPNSGETTRSPRPAPLSTYCIIPCSMPAALAVNSTLPQLHISSYTHWKVLWSLAPPDASRLTGPKLAENMFMHPFGSSLAMFPVTLFTTTPPMFVTVSETTICWGLPGKVARGVTTRLERRGDIRRPAVAVLLGWSPPPEQMSLPAASPANSTVPLFVGVTTHTNTVAAPGARSTGPRLAGPVGTIPPVPPAVRMSPVTLLTGQAP